MIMVYSCYYLQQQYIQYTVHHNYRSQQTLNARTKQTSVAALLLARLFGGSSKGPINIWGLPIIINFEKYRMNKSSTLCRSNPQLLALFKHPKVNTTHHSLSH